MPRIRLANPITPLQHPPAIWTAFAVQGRWKNWVLAAQLLLLALLAVVCLAVARTAPDVIVVDDAGQSHYLPRGVASQALRRFLDSEVKRPSDLTLLSFTERFLKLTLAVNSTTIDEAWAESTAMMAAPLQEQMQQEAKAQQLLESYRLAQVRTALAFEDVRLVERVGGKAHLQATVARSRGKLQGDAAPTDDRLQVDLVLAEVPRSRRRPDGLEVLQWSVAPAAAPTAPAPAPTAPAPAPTAPAPTAQPRGEP